MTLLRRNTLCLLSTGTLCRFHQLRSLVLSHEFLSPCFIGSDDSSKSRTGNQKSEQDALHTLLESLENKRKSTKKIEEKEGMKEKDDKNVMMHSSVHNRIANARKKFMETEEPMELDHETEYKQREWSFYFCLVLVKIKLPDAQSGNMT